MGGLAVRDWSHGPELRVLRPGDRGIYTVGGIAEAVIR